MDNDDGHVGDAETYETWTPLFLLVGLFDILLFFVAWIGIDRGGATTPLFEPMTLVVGCVLLLIAAATHLFVERLSTQRERMTSLAVTGAVHVGLGGATQAGFNPLGALTDATGGVALLSLGAVLLFIGIVGLWRLGRTAPPPVR